MSTLNPPQPKFFLFFSPSPAGKCCFCWSLKCAIYYFAILDILASIALMLSILSAIFSSDLVYPNADMEICALPFAILGIQGVSRIDIDRMHLYFVFKEIEAITILLNILLYTLIGCYDNCGETVLTNLFLVGWNIYFAYIVWSAEITVRANVGTMELYGRDAKGLGKGPEPWKYVDMEKLQKGNTDPVQFAPMET